MLFVGILIEGFVVVLANLRYDNTVEVLQAMARFSGRFSLFIFLFTFMIASFYMNPKHETFSKGIELEKRLVGTFAIMHLIHFGFLASFIYVSGTELIIHRLMGGILAYLLIVSYPLYMRRADVQTRQFNILRRVYYYYVLFVFFMTYLPRIMGTLPNVGGSSAELFLTSAWY